MTPICYSSGSLFICNECKQTLCAECSGRVHQHPKRAHHKPDRLHDGTPDDTSLDSSITTDAVDSVGDYELPLSQYSEQSFSDAMLVATLAKAFDLTSFKSLQKEVIDATLQGRDTLVIQPTGSGKSLCFQFPPVYQNKKTIIVTPTISLMQDQVFELQGKGIPAVYLGSAQLCKHAEEKAMTLDGDGKIDIICYTRMVSKTTKCH